MLKEYVTKYHTKKMISWCTHENSEIHEIVLAFIEKGLPMESKRGVFEDIND